MIPRHTILLATLALLPLAACASGGGDEGAVAHEVTIDLPATADVARHNIHLAGLDARLGSFAQASLPLDATRTVPRARTRASASVSAGLSASHGPLDRKPMLKLMLTASTRSGVVASQSSAVITCDIQATLLVPSDRRIATMFAPGAIPRGAMPPLPAMTPATPVS